MRVTIFMTALIVVLTVYGCLDVRHPASSLGPGPAAIPPPPRRPRIIGDVERVSAADIREVIRLEQHEILKDYAKVLPIYTVRVQSKNHIEIQFWTDDGIESWRGVHRVKGKWTPDYVAKVQI